MSMDQNITLSVTHEPFFCFTSDFKAIRKNYLYRSMALKDAYFLSISQTKALKVYKIH